MDVEECRRRFSGERVARLATGDASGNPHLVPVTFAVLPGDVVVFAVDHKPKSTLRLRRLDNIAARPRVSFLADVYDDDWSRLWWVRADADAVVATDGSLWDTAVAALTIKYREYQDRPPHGPVVAATVAHWVGWAASEK